MPSSQPKSEEWICLEVSVSAAGVDPQIELFWELGTTGVEEVLEGEGVLLRAFFPGSCDRNLLRQEYQERSGSEPKTFIVSSNSADWVENYRKNFHGFPVGDHFYVQPSWESPSPGRINLVIDPGHAFGTGTHESTQLCLLAIEDLARRSRTMADVGTGSAILAIAAVKLVPDLRVIAFDNDHQATEGARENVGQNQADTISLFTGGPEALRGRYDLVVANLTLGIFQKTAGAISELVGRDLVVSGFTVDQDRLVSELFTDQPSSGVKTGSLRETGRTEANGWVCLRFTRADSVS